ncbi:MAG: ATP-binding protein [Pseudomonadales bacterium]|jgi:signal transduction histidine kinase|nr:ATP-binding protein [Pseudomonadales bacterium]
MRDSERIKARLDVVDLLEQDGDRFVTLGAVPAWLRDFGVEGDPAADQSAPFSLPGALLFFDSWLDVLREALAADPEAIMTSGPWAETDRRGVVRNLSATGLLLDGRIALQLRLVDDKRLYHQAVFQSARSYSLGYERLMKERERREMMLHAFVHDLGGPLTAIYGALEMLGDAPDHDPLVDMALEQCDVERRMIRSMLETFAAEFAPFDPTALVREEAPQLRALANASRNAFGAAFEAQQVTLTVVDHLPADSDTRVRAEGELLERVLANLLQNALRFSPSGTETRIELAQEGDRYAVAVVDAGSGVPDHLRPTLFDPFSRGVDTGGKAGLGLYFCRVTLARWGETIRCAPVHGEPGPGELPGTRMSFTLTPF